MDLFIQQIFAGLSLGSIYACTALAVVILYLSVRHLNYAQGEMAMFSTFVSWQLLQWGAPFVVAIAGSALVSFVAGLVIQRLLFEPIRNEPATSHIVVFIGLFSIFNGLAAYFWGASVRTFPSPFGTGPFLGLRAVSVHQVGMFATTLVMLTCVFAFFRYTRTGLMLRAAADNAASAHAVGIAVRDVNALAWGLSAAIGSVAGALIAPVIYLEPNMMLSTALSGFAGALLGGLGSPLGAVLGGYAVGLLENLVGTYVPVVGQELKSVIALLIVLVLMVTKGGSFLGQRVVKRF